LKFGTLVGIYEYYRAVYKNLSARWCLGRSAAPYFLCCDPPLYVRN